MKDLFSRIFIKKHWFAISLFSILLLAGILRFYNYNDRWGLTADTARDAIVAREAIRNFTIPPLGPFSSAGNYTTGNTWYIWLEATTLLFPFSIITPWIALSLSSILIVYLIILIGIELKDKKLGLILGIITAVSPAAISQSLNLTNPSIVSLFSTLVILFLIKYVKTKKNIYAFLFTFFISAAISTHFQSVYLLLLVPIVLILKKPKLNGFLIMALGGILPFISYAIHDINHNFYNFRGILDYVQYGQFKIYIPNRWLTYAGEFWPNLWSKMTGGIVSTGYIQMLLVPIVLGYLTLFRKINRSTFIIILWFLFTFVALRYYRGERFDGYFVFLHPFIIILSGLTYYTIFKVNKFIGILLFTIILATTFLTTLNQIKSSTNYTAYQANYWAQLLREKYPSQKITLYTFGHSEAAKTLPLALYLMKYDLNDMNGRKIGFGMSEEMGKKHFQLITENSEGHNLWDLGESSDTELKKSGWTRLTSNDIYNSTVNWYK